MNNFSDSEIIAVLQTDPQKRLADFWTGKDVVWGLAAKGLSLGRVSQDLFNTLLRKCSFDYLGQECGMPIFHPVLPVL